MMKPTSLLLCMSLLDAAASPTGGACGRIASVPVERDKIAAEMTDLLPGIVERRGNGDSGLAPACQQPQEAWPFAGLRERRTRGKAPMNRPIIADALALNHDADGRERAAQPHVQQGP